MKKIITIISILCYIVVNITAQSGIDGYVRIYMDNFDGNSLLPEEYYHNQHGGYAQECACIEQDESLYQVQNGKVNLRAYSTPGKLCDPNGTDVRDYSTQYLRTSRLYKYGRFTIYAAIPKGPSLFPAFWLFGGSSDPNMRLMEIDIFEMYSVFNEGESNVIFRYYNGDRVDHRSGRWSFSDYVWTKYTLDWRPDYMKLLVNDVCIKNLENNFGAGTMDVSICQQMTNDYGLGNPDPTKFPYDMLIDYFSVDYPIDTNQIITLNTFSGATDESRAYAGKEVLVSQNNGSVIVKGKDASWSAGQNLDLIATNRISIKPGFHAESTSRFRAWLVDRNNLKSATASENSADSRYHIQYDKKDTTVVSENNDNTIVITDTPLKISSLSVFPNPTKGKISVSVPENEVITSVVVTDLAGRYVSQYKNIHSNIDISNLPNGNYLITINTKNQKVNKIFTKY